MSYDRNSTRIAGHLLPYGPVSASCGPTVAHVTSGASGEPIEHWRIFAGLEASERRTHAGGKITDGFG